MKNRLFLVVGLSVVILIALVSIGSGHAVASVGGTGIPVRCYKSGAAIAPGGEAFLSCVAVDGPAFAEGQRVPDGYYLLVMDVLVTPDAGTATGGILDINLFDAYGTSSRQSTIRLRNDEPASFGFNRSAPYLVLVAGHRLEVTSTAFSTHGADVRIGAILTTNLNFLPSVFRGQ